MSAPGTPGSQIPPREDALVRRVADLERFVRELGPSIARSFSGTVADLTAAQADLATAQATLSDTVAELGTTQAQLETAQDDLAVLVDNQIAVAAAAQRAAGFIVNTSDRTATSVSIPVPSGYTRALVSAGGTVSGIPTSDVDRILPSITIAGDKGSGTYGYVDGAFGGGGTAFHSVTLTGLSGGNISVVLSAHWLLSSGVVNGNSYAVLSATATFLR